MSYHNNPYYHPEYHGLKVVGAVELSEPSWSFDTLVCWQDLAGQFYLGTDSGCSCPTPFESYDGVADMTGPLTREQAIEESRSIYANSYGIQGYDDEDNYVRLAGYEPERFDQYITAIEEA